MRITLTIRTNGSPHWVWSTLFHAIRYAASRIESRGYWHSQIEPGYVDAFSNGDASYVLRVEED